MRGTRLLVLALSSLAFAKRTSLDKDGDGITRRTSLDKDGDGTLSHSEVEGSKLFRETDSNGDGTLEAAELMDFMKQSGAEDLFQEAHRGVDDAVKSIDVDHLSGIQGGDLVKHWEQLSSLLTAEEVADWISHAVLLPQYASAFRENGVKGLDLPLLLEEPEYLKEIGVTVGLHCKQIQRAISLRLLGIGKVPEKPTIQCVSGRVEWQSDGRPVFHIGLKWDGDPLDRVQVPIHRWRLLMRWNTYESWKVVGTYEGSEDGAVVVLTSPRSRVESLHNLMFKVEAWNAIGKSEAGRTWDCPIDLEETFHSQTSSSGQGLPFLLQPSSGAVEPLPQNAVDPVAVRLNTMHIFANADLDGDGDIDLDEMEQLIRGLSETTLPSDKRKASYGEKVSSEFLKSRGVESGIKSIDGDKDQSIVPEELETHWQSLQSLMTVEQTVRWLIHAVELPEYQHVFQEHEITGFDLPSLVANDGISLIEKLGISNEKHRKLLIRAITILVMGIGKAPSKIHYVDVRPGDQCATIRLDWSASVQSSSRSNEMPTHKYVVLRRSDRSGEWKEVYSGMSTSFLDSGLDLGTDYVYRVEAWNLLGVSPSFESHQMQPNRETCVSIPRLALNGLLKVALIPFHLIGLLADNYYRITAFLSFVGFAAMFANMPHTEKKRMIIALNQKIVPVLKGAFGTAFGFDIVLSVVLRWLERRHGSRALGTELDSSDTSYEDTDSTPLSPHKELINRAIEATFPTNPTSRKTRPMQNMQRNRSAYLPRINTVDSGNRVRTSNFMRTVSSPHPRLGPSAAAAVAAQNGSSTQESRFVEATNGERSATPTNSEAGSANSMSPSNSKWGLIRQHLMQRRVVKAWASTLNDSVASSDTETSSAASFEPTGSPRVQRKGTSRMRISFRRKKRPSSENITPMLPQPLAGSHAVAHAQSLHGNTRHCTLCGVSVGRFTRHVCGHCHFVYCDKHTAHAPHMFLLPCGVESKCLCVNCAGQGQ